MGKKPKSDTPARKKRKYQAAKRKAITKSLIRTVTYRDRPQDHDLGVGWDAKMEGTRLILTADIDRSKEIGLSNSEKSYNIANSHGPFSLAVFGYPDHFFMGYVYRRRPIDERVDVQAIREFVEKDDYSEGEEDV